MRHDDTWLEPHADLLMGKAVLELGCGSGRDTAVLSELADNLVSGDLAPCTNSDSAVLVLDHSKALPFENTTFDTVVASLCLHYFSLSKTHEILEEIARVLKTEGSLLCRVNSYKDENHGSVGYPEIEPGLYDVKGNQKRFFREHEILAIWSPFFRVGEISDNCIDRYQEEKFVYEFSAIKV